MQSRIFTKIFLILSFIAVISIPAHFSIAQESSVGERITNFSVDIHIHQNASMDVTEEITYDFDNNSRHGIFRNIPVKYSTSLGNASIRLSDISVTDGTGKPYEFTVSNSGKNRQIKIGDPDTLISGIKMYVIRYHVERAIGYFNDFDELYWNVTGNEWEVPIDKADAVVYLPKNISKADLRIACYEGPLGSSASCKHSENNEGSTAAIGMVTFSSQAAFGAGEGLTVAVGFPKGTVTQPTAFQNFMQLVRDNWILILPVIVFAIMFRLWYTKGKDPKGRGTIVPEYDAPDNLTPLEISAVLHEGARNQDISAQIIYLATKGFLRITRVEEKGLLFSHTDYTLTKLKKISEATNPIDIELLEALYIDDTGSQDLKISSLKNNFYKKLPAIKKAVTASVIEKGYYLVDPMKVRGKYIGIGVACFVLIWLFGMIGILNAVVVISIILSGGIIILFGYFMPTVTKAGAIAREQIKGLKQYITVAEKDRINFHNAPEKNPELFEKLLPYAVVLGVENQWAKQFESIYMTPPSWYNDPSGGVFNAVILSNSLHSFSSEASSTFASSPGGGSGGGGFSGGGGGGGGGGSW